MERISVERAKIQHLSRPSILNVKILLGFQWSEMLVSIVPTRMAIYRGIVRYRKMLEPIFGAGDRVMRLNSPLTTDLR